MADAHPENVSLQLDDLLARDEQTQDIRFQLQEIKTFLERESKHVINESNGVSLFQCIRQAIQSVNLFNEFTEPEAIKNGIVDLLSTHKKQFQAVVTLLVENISAHKSESLSEEVEFYENVISDIKDGRNIQFYTHLCAYAAATCLNTPIYIVYRNEFGRYGWAYFQPLFTFEGQPRSTIEYLTVAMTSDKTFYLVKSLETMSRPKATGLVGMYKENLEELSPLDTTVPGELLGISDDMKKDMCYKLGRDILLRACILFLQRRLITFHIYNNLTGHRAPRQDFYNVVAHSQDAFQIVCQVLIHQRQKTILKHYVQDWNTFVRSCDYIRHFNSLGALDNAIISRNSVVSEFVTSCQLSVRELDKRRKTVTTTVIASSSVGIVSGGMAIAGLVLAPFSFGASLGLTLAGGAIGVGSGLTAGVARTYEAVKQNSKINDIKEEQIQLQTKEQEVADALERTELLFQRVVETGTNENTDIGISRRGFLAIGSAARVTNSVAHVALTAVRIGARAASISAAVLGPLSMVFDIAFLAEAAHNKANGDKTNAGEILQGIAETIETKSKIFNGILRGDLPDSHRMDGLYRWN